MEHLLTSSCYFMLSYLPLTTDPNAPQPLNQLEWCFSVPIIVTLLTQLCDDCEYTGSDGVRRVSLAFATSVDVAMLHMLGMALGIIGWWYCTGRHALQLMLGVISTAAFLWGGGLLWEMLRATERRQREANAPEVGRAVKS